MGRTTRTCALGALICLVLPARIGSTSAQFSHARTSSINGFAGATFSPLVAPVITPRVAGSAVVLTWDIVTMSSGASLTYVVTRTSDVGVQELVCTAALAITITATTAQCRDDTALGTTLYTYSQQPVLVIGGVATWTRPLSAPSIAVCVKKCK